MINDALDLVIAFRRDNADVFEMGDPHESIIWTIEELTELSKVWDKSLGRKRTRKNKYENIDVGIECHLEFGQAMMDLLSIAIQIPIDPDFALHLALETADDRCRDEREKRLAKENK